MERLQEIFPQTFELIQEAIAGPADLSLIQSILWGTLALILAFALHIIVWFFMEAEIMTICYPEMTIWEEDEYKKGTSLVSRIFLIRARREAKKRRISAWIYWLVNILNGILLLLSITLWISTIVTRRGAMFLLALEMPLGWSMLSIVGISIYDMIFVPEERKRELDRYRWDRKKK